MNNLVRWDPFAELATLQKQFFGDDPISTIKGINIPTTDVYMKNDNLIVEAHLPNFVQKDINVQIEDGVLIINAERHEQEEDKDKKYVVRESSSSFYRRIAMPKRADANKISAHLDDGILKVTIPLTPLPEPKKVEITSKKK